MKTYIKSRISKLLTLTAAAVMCISSAAFAADGNKPTTDKDKLTDHLMMKGGKMMVMKGGESKPMKEDMTLTDGSKVMTDGTVMTKGGDKMMLKDDDMITMDGKMTKGGSKTHGADPATGDPKTKEPAEGGSKSGQEKK